MINKKINQFRYQCIVEIGRGEEILCAHFQCSLAKWAKWNARNNHGLLRRIFRWIEITLYSAISNLDITFINPESHKGCRIYRLERDRYRVYTLFNVKEEKILYYYRFIFYIHKRIALKTYKIRDHYVHTLSIFCWNLVSFRWLHKNVRLLLSATRSPIFSTEAQVQGSLTMSYKN